MAVDREKLNFQSKLFALAKREFRASCHQPEARVFVDSLYQEYQSVGLPRDIEAWLRRRLETAFRFVALPPVWVHDEPEWLFHDDTPMVFVGQLDLPANETTRDHLTWNSVVYIFAARVALDKGFRIAFEEVVQERGTHGVGER